MFRKRPAKQELRQRPTATVPRNAAVFSYHAARSRRPEAGGRDMQRDNSSAAGPGVVRSGRRGMRRVVWWLAIVLLAGAGASISWVDPEPRIVSNTDQERQTLLQNDEIYAQAATQFIGSSLTNRNKLTFDGHGVSESMRKQFPELSQVVVTLPLLGQRPTVHVKPFTPRLIFVSSGSGTFVLDREGRAFVHDSAVQALERFELPVVRDQSGLAIQAGQIALPEREVTYIAEVHRQLRAHEVPVASITLPPGGSELEVRVRDLPYVVRFNLYGDAREGAGRYLAAKAYLEARGQMPDGYIDARVENRVYLR